MKELDHPDNNHALILESWISDLQSNIIKSTYFANHRIFVAQLVGKARDIAIG